MRSAPLAGRLDRLSLLLLLFYVASQVSIGWILQPLGMDRFLAFQLATDKTAALALLEGWGAAGRERFLQHFYLDFVHPLLYGALLFTLLRRWTAPLLPAHLGRVALLLPWVAAACDLAENVLEIRIVRALDAVPAATVLWSGRLAQTKWLLAGLCIAGVIGGLLTSALRRPAAA